MGEFVGIQGFDNLYDFSALKQHALLFQRIAVPELEEMIGWVEVDPKGSERLLAEIPYLMEKGIIFEPKMTFPIPDEINREVSEFWEQIFQGNLVKNLDADELRLRLACIQLREIENIDAYPILARNPSSVRADEASKSDVVDIVINSLPVPDDSVPWEAILDYRSDPDTQHKFFAIRNWMNEVVSEKLSANEITDKIEWLTHEYQEHMKVHRLKTKAGVVETVVVAAAEFAEDLVKLKWGNIAKGLFSFNHRRIALMEGELKAPGREIAYITKARDKFSSGSFS